MFGLAPAAMGTMMLFSRFWDAVNDPLMGMIADRTDTKWGKFRPYIAGFAIPIGLAGFLAFNTPNFDFTRSIKDSLSREQWNNISKNEIKRIENKKFGIRNFVEKIIEYIEKKGHRVMSITQIFNMWSNNLK